MTYNSIEINCETGEEISVPMSNSQIKELEIERAAHTKMLEELEAQKAQMEIDKAAVLNKLGLTADEAKLLLG